MEEDAAFKSGFVSLLGRPNVGKSTLMNRVLGAKIAITSPKPQTTRNKIVGIHTAPGHQIIFLDTPGIHKSNKPLNRMMVKEAKKAAADADLAVMIIEADNPWTEEDLLTLDLVETLEMKRVLAINKVDKVHRAAVLPLIDHSSKLSVFEEIVPLSALKGDNVDRFVEVVAGLLEEGPLLFPDDVLTDQAERFWAAEIIREKVVRRTRQEIPYSTAVMIEEFAESPGLIRIKAAILVERETQKRIVIGKAGAMIKEIGSAARHDLENFWGQKVFLELYVKHDKNWWRTQTER